MKTRDSLVCFAFVCAAALCDASAQSTIPDGFATRPGASYTNYPFGRAFPARVQYLYDKSLIRHPVTPIQELAVRGEIQRSAAAKSIELEIRLSSTQARFDAASTTFAQNVGKNVLVAFTKKTVNLPGFIASPAPNFGTVFKLDKAFFYLKVHGNLLIDYMMSASAPGSYATNVVWSIGEAVNVIGASCTVAVQTVDGGSSLNTTSTLVFRLSRAPANGAAVHVLGLQRLPKPAVLPYGSCLLEIAPFLIRGRATSATGTASVTYPISVGTRTLTGPRVFGQWIALGSTWDSSYALEVIIGGYLPCARVFNLSSATAATGTPQIGAALVHSVR